MSFRASCLLVGLNKSLNHHQAVSLPLRLDRKERVSFLDGEETLQEPYKTMEKAQAFLDIDQVLTKEHFFVNEETGYYCAKRPENMKKTFYTIYSIFDWEQARLDRIYDGSLLDASFEPSDSTFS